jgi:hypothetical protein
LSICASGCSRSDLLAANAEIIKACAGFGWSGAGMLDRGMAGMCEELGS